MDIKDQVKSVENEVRDVVNWLSVFQEEYDLDDEVVEVLRERLQNVARKVGNIKC